MRGTRAALRYAKAALAFANETKAATHVAHDFTAMGALLRSNTELQDMLVNPLLPSAQKESVLISIFPEACSETRQVFSLLAQNNRLALLFQTGIQYLDLYAKQQGEVTAYVTTAVPLSSELETVIRDKAKALTQSKIQFENKIDPSILGGFILKIGDIQYDASITHQLQSLKTILTKTNSI
jgi:F-type H+-transporting ATPase subunit delta